MKKHILLLSFFLFTTLGFTQVGVNTTSPHPSSMLDISATDKGVLVPRVSLNNVTTTMLDGTNTAATGLLIWNTNAATTGGNGIGFYFFNGTQWMPITQTITDDQTIDNFSLSGTTLRLSLENDGQPLQTVNLTSLVGTDDQNLTTPTLTGTTLNLGIESGTGTSIDLAPLQDGIGTDDQIIDNFSLSGTTLRLSLENDGQPLQTVNLTSLVGTDDQNLTTPTLTGTTLNLGIESGTGTSIDLAPLQDGTGTDDQIVDNFSLSGTTLRLSLENDGLPLQTVNLSSLQDGTGTDDQNLTTPTLTGTTLNLGIESGTGTSIDLAPLQDGTGTDDQIIDNFSLSGTTLRLSLENDGQPLQTVNLTSLVGTDDQNLTTPTLVGTTLNLGIESGTGTSIDLAPIQDGTGTDDQIIDNFSLSGTTLRLSLENDGLPLQTVNLATLDTQNTLDQAYDEGGPGAGRIITANNGAVLINGNDGFQTTGTHNTGATLALTGAGTKMFFYPRKSAFRAGYVTGTQWDDANIGNYSIALGLSPIASNSFAVALGRDATATGASSVSLGWNGTASGGSSIAMNYLANASGDYSLSIGRESIASGEFATSIGYSANASNQNSVAIGNSTISSGIGSVAIGQSTSSSGFRSLATGYANNAFGDYSTSMGRNTSAFSAYETVIGLYSTIYTPNSTTAFDPADRLFVVGNGSSAIRSNALTIYKNGLMNINDEYNMPLVDGVSGQVMTTDGSGNVTFQNVPGDGTGTDDQNIQNLAFNSTTNVLTVGIENGTSQTVNLSALDTGGDITSVTAGTGLTGGGVTGAITLNAVGTNGLTTNADDIRLGGALIQATTITQGAFSMDINLDNTGDFSIQDNGTDVFFVEDTGDIGIGTSNPAYPLHIIESVAATINGVYLDKTDNSTADTSGLFIQKTGNGDGRSHAIFTDVDGSGIGQKYGIFNRVSSTALGNQYGTRNFISGASPSNQFGTFNNLDNAGTANHYGVYNGMRGTAASNLYATYNEFDNGTTAANLYGTYTNFSVNATGTGSKYGSYTSIDTSLGGTHYGTYNDVGVANGWAGYFLGNSYFSNSVGIGTTTPDYNLSVSGTLNLREDIATGGAALRVNGSEAIWFDGNQFSWGFGGTVNFFSDDVGIGINAPAYKLDVRENLNIGYVAQIYNTSTNVDADGLRIQLNATTPGATNAFIGFLNGAGTIRGQIVGSATGVNYNTTSDRRLKTNINDIDNALNLIDKIQPRIYEYKSNLGTEEYGFIAQELQPLYPQAVSGTPDSDVETNPMMVDYSRLTPLLTAGIKELKEEVNLLKFENEKLKAQLTKYEQLEARLSDLENNAKKDSDLILVSKN